MQLKKIDEEFIEFVFECLKELRGGVDYSLQQFREYVIAQELIGNVNYEIIVGCVEDTPVAILTCNRFAMPRYLGFGIELEEVIVHPEFQGNGYGKKLLQSFVDSVSGDATLRKLLVKSDDQLKACRLYQQFFDEISTQVYGLTVNYL